jgi:hypothetical protein
MNHMAGRQPYPQGCGRILWIPGQRSQRRIPLARPEAGPSVTPSVPIRARLTSLSNVTLSPNKYTSWGKPCGLRWEMRADLGIDCGRYVVIPSCPRSFAGIYAGAGETVPHLELRIRQLSPASTQPTTTTYVYIFVPQDRQVIGTGALGDNPTPGSRVLTAGHHPYEPDRDLRAVSGLRRAWQEQMISRTAARPERFTTGIVTGARHVGRWPTKQTNSSRPSSSSRLSRPGPGIARRMVSQSRGMSSALCAGLRHRPWLRTKGELRWTRPRNAFSASAQCEDRRRSCRTAAVSKTGAGGAASLVSVRKRQTRHPVTRPFTWLCDYSRRRFL